MQPRPAPTVMQPRPGPAHVEPVHPAPTVASPPPGPGASAYAPGHGNLPPGHGGIPPGQVRRVERVNVEKVNVPKNVDKPRGPKPAHVRDDKRRGEN